MLVITSVIFSILDVIVIYLLFQCLVYSVDVFKCKRSIGYS